MTELVRSGNEDRDRESWMRRVAAVLARQIVETLLDEASSDEAHEGRVGRTRGKS